MDITDTHTHLSSFAKRGNLDATLARAKEGGVTTLITVGTEPEDWVLYREIVQNHAGFIYYTVGLHPCSVEENWRVAVDQIEAFFKRHTKPVALGEMGLDRFHLPKENEALAQKIMSWQKDAFERQLALAKNLKCPVVIHSRGAFRECVEMIDRSGVDWARVVFHCFTEGVAEMAELTRRSAFGSFTGILTYKTADIVRAAAKAQGLQRLMIETDAPYLTPMPHRGKSNEPLYLRNTAEYAAELFGVSLNELAEVTTRNAKVFFGI